MIKNFQRKALVTSVAAALTGGIAGSAMAAGEIDTNKDIVVSNAPTKNGEAFVPGELAKMRVDLSGYDNTADVVTLHVVYLDSDGATLRTASTTGQEDATGDSDATLLLSGEDTTDAVSAVVIVQTSAGDSWDATGDFAYIDKDGNTSPGGFATQADALQHAKDNDKTLDVDADYKGIKVVEAKRDKDTDATEVYITFNADPKEDDLTDEDASHDTTNLVKIADSIGDPIATMFKEYTADKRTIVLDASPDANAILSADPVSAITSTASAPKLDDGTGKSAGGNPVKSASVTITTLQPPAYAGSGKVAVVRSVAAGSVDDVYPDADGLFTGVTGVNVNIRLDQAVTAASYTGDATPDVTAMDTDITVTENGLIADASGDNSILDLTLTRDGSDLFFVDPATGAVTYGADAASAVAVTVTVQGGADVGGLGLAFNNGETTLDSDLAATPVMAGIVQTRRLATRDDDGDGWLDGGTFDFRQDLSDPDAANHNLGLVSYQDQGADGYAVLGTDTLEVISDSEVALVLTNPDVPQADGTAPDGNGNNDYNDDGTEDEDDAALAIDDNLNTGVTGTGGGGGDVPFGAYIGVDDFSDPSTSLTYAYAWDAQTGANLEVGTGMLAFTVDGASPIVKDVTYTQTQDAVDASTDAYGDVTIDVSEDVTSTFPDGADEDAINEYLFDGQTAGLLNAFSGVNVNVTIDIDNTDDTITLSNVPRTVLDTVLSLGVTGGAEDTSGNKLIVSGDVDVNTVAEGSPAAPELASVTIEDLDDDETFETLFVEFDQLVEAPAGQVAADLDGVFIVRAAVGWDENRRQAEHIHQFIIPGANVDLDGEAGTGNVTITIPGNTGLPDDTIQVWVDYEGANEAERDDGDLGYVQNTDEVAAHVDGDRLFDNAAGNNRTIADTEDAVDDEDTIASDEEESPYFTVGAGAQDNRNLFTQLIKGTVKYDGVAAQENTTVRLDLVRLDESTSSGFTTRKAVVGNGYIDVRMSSNSEFSEDNEDDVDSWITLALLNKALTGADYDAFASAVKSFQDAAAAVESAIANNKDTKTIDSLRAKETAAENVIITKYNNNSPNSTGTVTGSIHAYVEITNGSGKNAQDGAMGQNTDADNNAMANGNASYGRTATLHKTIPNIQRDGTSYYPVEIDLSWNPNNPSNVDDLELDGLGVGGDLVVDDGRLQSVSPVLSTSSTTTMQFEVLDTAFARTDADGNYRATVGMDEKDLTSSSKGLTNEHTDACVLVSVHNRDKDFGDNEYVLTNSCESSFTSHIPFAADILGDATPTVHNIEMENISRTPLFNDGDWELLAIDGPMARTNTSDLDSGLFWLQTRPFDGEPVTLWKSDGGWGDQMFTMGLGSKGGEVDLAFELGDDDDNVNVGGINPAPGAAIGFFGDDEQHFANHADGVLNDNSVVSHELAVPVTGTAVSSTLEAGWHLITVGEESSVDDIVSASTSIDALIVFAREVEDPEADDDAFEDGRGDNDGTVDNYAWFKGEDTNAQPFGDALAVFIHVSEKVEAFDHGDL